MLSPVRPLPSPANEPLKEPLTPPSAFKRSTLAPEPEITKEPVILESPFLDPSHSAVAVMPVSPEPSPKKPTEEVTLPLIMRLLFITCSLAIIFYITLLF